MDMFEKAEKLLAEALAEDKREGSRFDLDGWGNYFLEDWKEDPAAVNEAWKLYQEHWAYISTSSA